MLLLTFYGIQKYAFVFDQYHIKLDLYVPY